MEPNRVMNHVTSLRDNYRTIPLELSKRKEASHRAIVSEEHHPSFPLLSRPFLSHLRLRQHPSTSSSIIGKDRDLVLLATWRS